MDCKGVFLGRSGLKGEGKMEGVDRLGLGSVNGWSLHLVIHDSEECTYT